MPFATKISVLTATFPMTPASGIQKINQMSDCLFLKKDYAP
jgi:hypothetical protein